MKKLKAKKKPISIANGSVETIDEYLARGGHITTCETGARSEEAQTGQWTRNRRRVKPPTPVDKVELVPLTGNEPTSSPGE